MLTDLGRRRCRRRSAFKAGRWRGPDDTAIVDERAACSHVRVRRRLVHIEHRRGAGVGPVENRAPRIARSRAQQRRHPLAQGRPLGLVPLSVEGRVNTKFDSALDLSGILEIEPSASPLRSVSTLAEYVGSRLQAA